MGDLDYEQASVSPDFIDCALAALNRAGTDVHGEPSRCELA